MALKRYGLQSSLIFLACCYLVMSEVKVISRRSDEMSLSELANLVQQQAQTITQQGQLIQQQGQLIQQLTSRLDSVESIQNKKGIFRCKR